MINNLGITIQNEWLDILPGTRLDMEKANPFLQFENQLAGDYSLPFDVRLTPTNMKLLQWAGLIQTKVNTQGIECAAWDGTRQHSVGKIKIEKPGLNLISSNRASISLYYLTGVAGFFQDIKDAKLRGADYGGDRSFTWDGYNKAGAGFWSHIHQVINGAVNAFDYAFFPVINKGWTGDGYAGPVSNDVMNNMAIVGGQLEFLHGSTDEKELNAIVPFPYLHYVLNKALASVGWTIEGAILNDPDFRKITMLSFQAIDWGFMSAKDVARWAVLGGTTGDLGTHPATVTFNLSDHVPDLSVSDFLLSLKNRFGWWFDFDNKNKTIKINELQSVISTARKDMTSKATPLIEKKVAQKQTIYGLKNEFVGEYAGGAPSLSNVKYMGHIGLKSALPAADKTLNAQTYLVVAENNFYICRPDPTADPSADAYSWQFYAYNVFDIAPEGQTESITTKATAIGVEPYNAFLDLVPRMDLTGNWNALSYSDASWGIHLLMYHGKRNNKTGQAVPFATSGIYDSTGVQVSSWSLAFECWTFDGKDVGLYATKWKTILDSLKQPESFEFSLNLPLAEYMELKFSDTILVGGVKMYLTKIKPSIPYTGVLPVEAIRII